MPQFPFSRREFYLFMKKHNLSFRDCASAFKIYDLSALGQYLNNNKNRAKTIRLRKLREQELIQPSLPLF